MSFILLRPTCETGALGHLVRNFLHMDGIDGKDDSGGEEGRTKTKRKKEKRQKDMNVRLIV